MDIATVMQAISSLGFPIVACIAIAWYFNKVNDGYRADIKELNQQNREQLDKLTEAIANNTLVVARLVEKLDKEE
jgi:hypothetical protein